MDALFEKETIEGVIHFAASSQVGESMVDPLKYYDNNLWGTTVLLQSMVAHGVDKIVFSSTAATYGEPERVPILESDRTEPTNCYGETKLAMERMMSWTSRAHGLRYVALRYFSTTVLLQSMVAHGVDKIVFSSTAATYGEPERVPILESDRTEPTNCYGETKLAMERMMSWTSRAHGLRYVALRYFNACGAHPSGAIGEAHDPETHLIPLILQVPNGEREKISVFGDDYPTRDGTCVRDYIHVTDLAQAHILALDYLLAGGENNVFNLGNGVGFTVKEVIDVTRKVTGHPIPAEICPRRAGDPAQLVASSEKAKTVLGWKPQYAELAGLEAPVRGAGHHRVLRLDLA